MMVDASKPNVRRRDSRGTLAIKAKNFVAINKFM